MYLLIHDHIPPLFSALLEVLSLLHSDTEERYTRCGWIRCNPLLKTCFISSLPGFTTGVLCLISAFLTCLKFPDA